MFKAIYQQPRTFNKYAQGKVIVYPNEKVIDNYQPESSEGQESIQPYTAYEYEGTERDGGIVVDCTEPSNVHDLTDAIVRTKYSVSEELALQRHHQVDPDGYDVPFTEYCNWADKAATMAKAWLA